MMVWIQVLVFLITNLPGLVKSLKELMEILNGDRQVAKAVLTEMRAVKDKNPGQRKQLLKAIIDKYARY